MRTSLRDGLKAAIKARDRVAVSALRSALAAIDNAEAVSVDQPVDSIAGAAIGLGAAEVERRQLDDAELRSIVEREVRDRSAAALEYTQLGRADHAERLTAEAEVLGRYL